MYELIQAGERSYYVNVPVKIGLYRVSDDEVYLIDSGGDKDAGRKLRQILDKKGWTLKAILNTHSNADHIGGNQYLQKQTAKSKKTIREKQKQIRKLQEEIQNTIEKESLILAIEMLEKKSVWFLISEQNGKYYIVMYYDNEYNMANGEDL